MVPHRISSFSSHSLHHSSSFHVQKQLFSPLSIFLAGSSVLLDIIIPSLFFFTLSLHLSLSLFHSLCFHLGDRSVHAVSNLSLLSAYALCATILLPLPSVLYRTAHISSLHISFSSSLCPSLPASLSHHRLASLLGIAVLCFAVWRKAVRSGDLFAPGLSTLRLLAEEDLAALGAPGLPCLGFLGSVGAGEQGRTGGGGEG